MKLGWFLNVHICVSRGGRINPNIENINTKVSIDIDEPLVKDIDILLLPVISSEATRLTSSHCSSHDSAQLTETE